MIEIKKLGYSSSPWRVVIDGEELYSPELVPHPTMGKVLVNMPVCGNTKQSVVDKMLNLLVIQNERIREMRKALENKQIWIEHTVNRIFESECKDYPHQETGIADRLWAIEQSMAGRRLALEDIHKQMRDRQDELHLTH
jgi:hypothetical protein